MESLILNTMLVSFVCGVIFAIMGSIMYYYPPKEINYLYGYRTASSMKSQERWDFAQKFSAALMRKAGVVLAVISLPAYFIPVAELVKFMTGIAAVILSVAYVFIATEKAIKNKFQN